MAYRYHVGSDLSGSNFLDEPGTYHMVTTKLVIEPLDENDEPTNTFMDLQCQVVAGTVEGQVGKTLKLKYFRIKDDATEQGRAFRQRQLDRTWLALNVITPKQLDQDIDIDPEWVSGHAMQFVVHLKRSKDPKYLELDGTDIWHVDDPACATVPKDPDALKLIKPQFRRLKNPAETAQETAQATRANDPPKAKVDTSAI